MRVLVVNAGSTSLKLHVVEGEESRAVDELVACDAVGHRVVHGGARFQEPAVVDDEVAEAIRELTPLAPLHNAAALRGIEEAQAALPDVPHVAVFDTAFHATLPGEATRYAIPERWHEWGVRRYGFHGLSVEWAASQVRVQRLVVCHLGGGCSVTAVLDGRSVETTMGFSPLEGVPMTTRSGSIDPGALIYLLRERGLTVDELDHALEHESGLAGLSGGSGDVRELEPDSLALAVYVHRIAAAVAASTASLGGLDAIVFTGGVGERSELVRGRVTARVRHLGDFEVRVVESREELVIARAVRSVLG
jgi:acetate kinase